MNTVKVTIGLNAMQGFRGKLEDRLSGAVVANDVYARIAPTYGAFGSRVTISVTAGEVDELLGEIDYVTNSGHGWDRYVAPETDRDRAEVRALRRLASNLRKARRALA